MPQRSSSGRLHHDLQDAVSLPDLTSATYLTDLINELATYIIEIIDTAYNFEQLRTTSAAHILRPLIRHLVKTCRDPQLVLALLLLKQHFSSLHQDDRGLNDGRASACELVAWRYLTHLSTRDELIEHLLCALPASRIQPSVPEILIDLSNDDEDQSHTAPSGNGNSSKRAKDLERRQLDNDDDRDYGERDSAQNGSSVNADTVDEEPFTGLVGLNTLEIAAIVDAKTFLSQHIVQRLIDDLWNGEIVFWHSLNLKSTREARVANRKKTDPYSRLRVPKYQKAFESLFFLSFLILYYVVLVDRDTQAITAAEVFLVLWIAAFTYDEYGELRDAGRLFYSADFWSLWDIGIVAVGFAWLVTRVVGLAKHSIAITDVSYDILSIQALFLVPRIFALLTTNPYFGTLIPCLKEMSKDFAKFLSVVAILFLGFLTTFTMLARGTYAAHEVLWIMVYVFFGSSYMGFDIASQISPVIGPPLMVIFVILTNILLLTSLIAILGQSLTNVMQHAREEYLFQYSVFVLEASASKRLTYFFPPWNMLSLLIRPLRLFLTSTQMRLVRIVLLKATHTPYVAGIIAYENSLRWLTRTKSQRRKSKKNRLGPLPIQKLQAQRFTSKKSLSGRT